jgi:hypothetical protein
MFVVDEFKGSLLFVSGGAKLKPTTSAGKLRIRNVG